jgi:hypothetical protein
MELEEMKNIWENMEESQKTLPFQMSEVSQLEYKKKTNVFKKGEIIGLVIAYTLAGFVLYKFNSLDHWYVRLSASLLVTYLLTMPLYTLYGVWKMKHIDLVQSNYKTVLEQFYVVKNNMNKAEKISFIASPFLFVASGVVLTKLFLHKNFFALNFQLPIIFLMGIAFVAALLLNAWAFKKRDKEFKSVKQLLEEENQSKN